MTSFYFFEVGGWLFLALKPSLQCHKTYVKEGFPDKVTGLWAFEGQMPYQKVQGSPIVVRLHVRYICFFLQKWTKHEWET